MKTSQFEAVKVAIKQDKTGYVLTLSIHPDEIPDEVMRDFVGARYQVVMVRLNGEEKPMNRDQDLPRDIVQLAGILCSDTSFHEWLVGLGFISEANTKSATDWLRSELGVISRAELKTNPEASQTLLNINEEFKAWKRNG
jgi:hypothetical protein